MNSSKQLIIGIIVLVLVVAAVMLIAKFTREDPSQYDYNFFKFEKQGMLWITYAEKDGQPYKIPFYYHPSELEDIVAHEGVEGILLKASNEKSNSIVYITLDPELESKAVVAAVEISRLTGERYNILNLKTKGALTRPPTDSIASTQSPIVTCADASEDTIVIYMTLSKANFIHVEQGCIVLEATSTEDLVRVADRFAYMIIGIMS